MISWNLIDTSNGFLLIDTFATLLDCVVAADMFVAAVQVHLSCVMQVAT